MSGLVLSYINMLVYTSFHVNWYYDIYAYLVCVLENVFNGGEVGVPINFIF